MRHAHRAPPQRHASVAAGGGLTRWSRTGKQQSARCSARRAAASPPPHLLSRASFARASYRRHPLQQQQINNIRSQTVTFCLLRPRSLSFFSFPIVALANFDSNSLSAHTHTAQTFQFGFRAALLRLRLVEVPTTTFVSAVSSTSLLIASHANTFFFFFFFFVSRCGRVQRGGDDSGCAGALYVTE